MKLESKSELQISGVVGWDEWSCRPWRASFLLEPEPDRCHWRRHALLTQLLADPHQHRVMIVCQFGKQRQSRRRSGEQSIRDVWLDEMTNTWDENLNRWWVWSSKCYNNLRNVLSLRWNKVIRNYNKFRSNYDDYIVLTINFELHHLLVL